MSARTRTRLGVVIAATLGAAVPFGALHAEPTLQDLLDRIEQQDQAIKVLQRKLEIQEETVQTAAKSTPVVKASEKGLSFGSADNANQITFAPSRSTSANGAMASANAGRYLNLK